MKYFLTIFILIAFLSGKCQDVSGKWTGKLWSSDDKTNTDTCSLLLNIELKDSIISGELSCYLRKDVYTVISVSGKFDKQKRSIVLAEKELLLNKLPDNWITYFLEYNLNIATGDLNKITGFGKCVLTSDPKVQCTNEIFKLSLQKNNQ